MNFIHAGDFHLGYAQYNLEERFRDIARTFDSVIRYALDNQVEFVLISGDLFHKRNINAPTYLQAYKVLQRLRDAEKPIPVFAIEGNHDLAFHRDGHSWLEILGAQGLLRVLRLRKDNGVEFMGDFADVGDVRIFGVKYLGASTLYNIPKIAEEISSVNRRFGKKYTILMMHFGMEGQKVRMGGEVPYSALSPLRGIVDYLALGHYHMSYSVDNWVFNGGAPEILSSSECGFDKGFYHVTDRGARLVRPGTRQLLRLSLDISRTEKPDDVLAAVRTMLDSRADAASTDMKPMVELTLFGNLNFGKGDIAIDAIKELIERRYSPIYSEVKIQRTDSDYTMNRGDIGGLSREQIELRVLSDMVRKDSRYRLHVDDVARTLIDVKKLAAGGADAAGIVKKMRESFERIQGDHADSTR